MDKLIYQRGEDAREPQRIELDIPDDLTCQEFLVICLRMAQALGYHEDTIRKAFGDIEEDDIKDGFETFISNRLRNNTIIVDKNQLQFLFNWKKPKDEK